MARWYNGTQKPSKSNSLMNNRTDFQLQNEEVKSIPKKGNVNSIVTERQNVTKFIQNTGNRNLGSKPPIPPIRSGRSNRDDDYNATDDINQDYEIIDEGSLPLKLFDGKKQSLSELSEESMSYIWLRRIKEIFLHMGDGKDERDDDPFVEFDMELARTDLINTCDRYIENERLAVTRKKTSTTTTKKTSQQVGSLQDIQDCIKELTNAINNPLSGDLSSLLIRCIKSLEEFDRNTHENIGNIRKQQKSNSELNAQNVLQLMQSLQMKEGKKEKSDLEIKQEWDMKKLYAEVFKMSYKQNKLLTEIEQEDLAPKKNGDDQPNFGNAIWWYSCDKANIYYQINSILRLENFELLMSYRYYLSDLCRMIEFMYKRRKEEQGDIAQTFYRAGHVSKAQLKKMEKQQKGQLISLLGFISATNDINIAKGYAQKQNTSKDNEKVLFEISIKPQEPCTAFAYIEGISFHPEEKEVLFSMGSTFTIDKVVEPAQNENFHRIQMTASEIDKTIIDDIRTKVENCTPSGRTALLAQYLMELGEYRAARKYLNSLLTQAHDEGILFNDPALASIYTCLGMTYARQNLHGDAIKAFKQALNTQARLEYSNNNVLANIHNNIGLAYVGLGHMDEAEETLLEAKRIQLRELNSNQQHLAAIYSNIGYVHYKNNHLREAKKAFSEAEEMYKKNSSKIAHDALEQTLVKAQYLTNYGHLLTASNFLTDTQKHYNDALKIYKSILPNNDPKLMQTHINIMLAYAQNGQYEEVIRWYEDLTKGEIIEKQGRNMFELNSAVTQESLALLHEFVGACYAQKLNQESSKKAIDVWIRALIFKRKARLEHLLYENTGSMSSILTAEQTNFINDGYRLAREYYKKFENKTNQPNEDGDKQLSNAFCLGFLFVESSNWDQGIKHLTNTISRPDQSNNNISYVANLLLADASKQRRKYEDAITYFDEALKRIESLKNEDRVLEIEVKLARNDCLNEIDSNEAISQLQKLGKSLSSNGADTQRISLQVIVYDTLAQYYLKKKSFELFDNVAEKSMRLKLRSFSQYHPSLATSLILIAERFILQPRYIEALDFYEHALEVHSLNLAEKHPKIRKICYAIGDIYCKLNKLSNAKEKYDVAENKSSNITDDDFLQQDTIDSKQSMDILIARISMYRHLAEYHEKEKNYSEAITQLNEIIMLLKEELSASVFEMSNEEILAKKDIDPETLINNLKQIVHCYVTQGDILKDQQDTENLYTKALNICLKLFRHKEESITKQLVSLYQKLSKQSENLGENKHALEFLRKTIYLQKPTIDILYRMGYLNVACNDLKEAITNYENISSDESTKYHKQLAQIKQEKLKEIKERKEQSKQFGRHYSSSSSNSDETTFNDESPNPSRKFSRSATNISATSHHKNETDPDTILDNTVDLSDYRAMAATYIQLDDYNMSIKYFEKSIKKHNKGSLDLHIFKESVETIEAAAHWYEQDDAVTLLPKLFHSLIKKVRGNGDFEKSDILVLADSFFQCAILYDQSSAYIKSTTAYISAFDLYLSKSPDDVNILTKDVKELLNVFIAGHLGSEKIIEVCKKHLVADDTIKMQLRIAVLYRENQIYDVEDVDGDDDTSNEARNIALKMYIDLLHKTDDILTKGVCYYNILRLYKNYIYEDDDGKRIVDGMISLLSKFTACDRRILIVLALHFLKEYDNNKDSCDMKSNRQLKEIEKQSINEELKADTESKIGQYLSEINDLVSAEEYWSSLVEQTECTIPSSILPLVHDSDSTINKIIRTIKQPENDTIVLFHILAKTYETLGDCYLLDSKDDKATDTKSFQEAEKMYKRAVDLLKQLKPDSDTIIKIEEKQKRAASKVYELQN